MASIERREGKRGVRYRALVRKRGHVESATFRRKTDAERWANGVEAKIDEGTFFPTTEARKRTVEELVERYIRDYVPQLRSGAQRARHLRWWADQLGSLRLADLTPAVIVELRDRLAREEVQDGKLRAGATANRYLSALARALSLAVKEWNWLPSNPAAKVSRRKEPTGRVRRLDVAERTRLLASCDVSNDSRLHPLVLLALASGGRQGELLGLQWSDLDFERGRVQFLHTKNTETRGVGVSLDVLAVLRERLVRHVSGLVFADRKGEPSFPRSAWETALKRAEIEDCRFHDLRHDFASRLAESGATLAELAEAMGHRTLTMVKRYSHLSEGHVADVTRRASEALLS